MTLLAGTPNTNRMNPQLVILSVLLSLTLSGCKTEVIDHTTIGPNGTVVAATHTENGKVYDDLRRILEKETFRATGQFSQNDKYLARRGAVLAAEADLASTVGKVVQSRNETLYNSQIYSVLHTESSNVLKGYDIISENWDEAKHEYTILIEGRGYRIAEEIHKYIK
jgi:hypothetical protein